MSRKRPIRLVTSTQSEVGLRPGRSPSAASAAASPGTRWRTAGAVELMVDADPHALYAIVSDVTRIGERSPECRSATWLSGVPGTVGAVFRGRNRSGWAARWSRRCEVTQADPGSVFAFRTIPERFDPSRHDSTTWTYRFAVVDRGTRVEHSYEITKMPLPPLRAVYGVLIPQHRDMRPQMLHNLEVLRSQVSDAGC